MRKKLRLALIICCGIGIKAQVGINMTTPEGTVHVDGQKTQMFQYLPVMMMMSLLPLQEM